LEINTRNNLQTKQDVAIDWLVEHPLIDPKDIWYIQHEMKLLSDLMINSEKESNDVKNQIIWKGIIPHLRLIHCLVDNEYIREAFLRSLSTLTKSELDKNSQIRRVCPWQLMCDKWQDPGFTPTTRVYSHLHDDFRHPISLKHSLVSNMTISPDKAKEKFYDLRKDVLSVKTNWDISGNGKGSVRKISNDYDENCIGEQFDGRDKKNPRW